MFDEDVDLRTPRCLGIASVYPGVSKASPLSAVEPTAEYRGLTRHISLRGRLDSNQRTNGL
jgi:hypothetical protein